MGRLSDGTVWQPKAAKYLVLSDKRPIYLISDSVLYPMPYQRLPKQFLAMLLFNFLVYYFFLTCQASGNMTLRVDLQPKITSSKQQKEDELRLETNPTQFKRIKMDNMENYFFNRYLI